jgi:iron(II)-dependent oxidoreductase
MKRCLFVLTLNLLTITFNYAQLPSRQGALKELFQSPSTSSDHDAWFSMMKKWRTDERYRLKYNDAAYLKPELGWLKKTFIYAQMMAHDRYFYDPVAGKYTVDRYLKDVEIRYGGLDAVLIWPTYPNIGVDNRNQYDLVADMPGGLAGVKQMIKDFKRHNVRVFFPIMIWDHGTRKIAMTMPEALMKEMKVIGADGMNGDTMSGIDESFKIAYDSLNYPVVFQPELNFRDLKMIEWNQMSWGYYWKYEYEPGLSIYKWLEPRHQVQITNRWAMDKSDDLQYAFFNGVGYNAWENIWGIWNQIPDRYSAAIRRISAIYRQFPDNWSSSDWEPYIPTLQQGIFATAFPGLDQTVYTIVNRDSINKEGKQLKLPYEEGKTYYDVWNGTLLTPEKVGDQVYLSFPIEGRGFGAVLAVESYSINDQFNQFLKAMHTLAAQPLNSFSKTWKFIPQHIVEIEKTDPAVKKPKGMMFIPGVKDYMFESNGVMIEGNELPTAVGIQHAWEKSPARSQKHVMDISPFYIDKYPVTNKQFKQFIDETHFNPKDAHNFLKDWNSGDYPKGWDNKPVTWISIEDARAYAKWAGKRLPHEWEWQYVAQGNNGRLYPWTKRDSTRMPSADTSRSMRAPTNVNAFPQGSSPFGVMDMVGNVWQWTDEYIDEHTRTAILKGGSYYRPQTSHWYFPQAYELTKYGKYLLMSPSIDRSGTIGFRCVTDKKE